MMKGVTLRIKLRRSEVVEEKHAFRHSLDYWGDRL